MSCFSHRAAHLSQRLGNYVHCAYCNATIYRTQYEQKRVKHSFCSKQCAGLFRRKTLKTVRGFKNKQEYDQKAFGVNLKIATALKTGEYPE